MDKKKAVADINAVSELADEVLTPFAKIHGELAASQVMSMVVLCNNHINALKFMRHMASDQSHVHMILALDQANASMTVGILNTFLHGKDETYCEAFKKVVSMILNKIDKVGL